MYRKSICCFTNKFFYSSSCFLCQWVWFVRKVCLKCEVGFISICSSIVPTVVHTLDYHTVRCHLRISFELIYLVTEDNVLNKDGRPTGLVTVTAIVRDRLKNWTWRKNNNLLKNLFFTKPLFRVETTIYNQFDISLRLFGVWVQNKLRLFRERLTMFRFMSYL